MASDPVISPSNIDELAEAVKETIRAGKKVFAAIRKILDEVLAEEE